MTSPVVDNEDLDFGEWVEKHGRKALIGLTVVLVIAGAIWLYMASARRKEAFASAELARARTTAEQGNLPLAANDLTRLSEQFSGTRAGDEASVLLAQIRLLQGQRDMAVTALQEFVQGNHTDDSKASAYALLGGGLEDQGKIREAGEAYRRASETAPVDFLKASYMLEAGRAFTAAADTAQARRAYEFVLTNYGELDQAAEARVRMAEIGGTVPPPPPAKREDS